MGVDIHMAIVKNGQIIKDKLFNGRDSEWFDEISGDGDRHEYDQLPWDYFENYLDEMPEEILNHYNEGINYGSYGHYGFKIINVEEFCKWFEEYQPDLRAGWVTTYTKWLIDNKHYTPDEHDVQKTLYKDDVKEDYHFIEYRESYEGSKIIYDQIGELPFNIDLSECYLVYYFGR